MKKALALVLALVLALSMGVSAFALDYVELVKVEKNPAGPTEIYDYIGLGTDTAKEKIVNTYDGGYFYVAVNTAEYKNVTVSSTGNVTAELVDYNPETMKWVESKGGKEVLTWSLKKFDGGKYTTNGIACQDVYTNADGNNAKANGVCDWYEMKLNSLDGGVDVATHNAFNHLTYADAKALEKTFDEQDKTTNYVVVCDQKVQIIKVTVADNYSAHFTEGTYTIKATKIADGKEYSAKTTVINDVVIYGYEYVKYSAEYKKEINVLDTALNGYSDYQSYKLGYKTAELNDAAIVEEAPAVISTTAFRAVEGKALTVISNGMTVKIAEVAAAQKGVNFVAYGYYVLNKAGEIAATSKTDNKVASIDFGFLGDQKIASDFTITTSLDMTWFDLRETFGVKVEEDDIVSFYLLKDGKLVKEYKIDFMTANYNEAVKIEIEGKAGDTLGEYQIVLEIPASEVAGEENPNTGAESVVGVVAALAVVSLASAAAVSLKK